jgi:hypothetical protein
MLRRKTWVISVAELPRGLLLGTLAMLVFAWFNLQEAPMLAGSSTAKPLFKATEPVTFAIPVGLYGTYQEHTSNQSQLSLFSCPKAAHESFADLGLDKS